MNSVVVRYRTKPDQADANQRLIGAVFEELRAKQPDGLRYAAFRLADDTFVHVAMTAEDAEGLPAMDAFRAFVADIKERCIAPPQPSQATLVGNYRLLEAQ